jgi:hypothetical protein
MLKIVVIMLLLDESPLTSILSPQGRGKFESDELVKLSLIEAMSE